MGRPSSPELVGRETEVSALAAALSAAEQADCRVMFVSGEAGVGKTRLLREAERQTRERGMIALHGECLELHGGELPYAPLVAALQGAHADLVEEALDSLPTSARLEIGRLVPELLGERSHDQLATDPSQYAKGRLYEWLLRLIRCLAREAAVLLAIEDLHWSDDATRDFITYLTRNAAGLRLALIATYRSDELRRDGADPDPMRRLVSELRRSGNVRLMTVERLGREDVMRQLDAILGRPADQLLLENVYERSQGNPFFVEELLDAGAGEAGARLPDSLLDALLLRVEALPAESLRVVRALGVIGRPAHQELLASVLGVPEDELSAPLRTAVGRHVLHCRAEDDAFEFHHALVREAVTADLMPGERKALHAAIAQALQDSGPASPAELASHWEAAGRPEVALLAHVAAGDEAERVYAFAEARRHFESALRLRGEGSDVDEVELLRRAADAARFTGDSDAAVALGRRALA